MSDFVAFHFSIFGIVQGVGFRPFVANLAREHSVFGSVANRGSFVEVYAMGAAEDVAVFRRELSIRAPERSTILKIDALEIEPFDASAFDIIESEHERGDIFVSPDIATCDRCRDELYDASNRRYLHPFINCTACGPRLTILDSMPYDRERTSMGDFPMCDECAREYQSPASRRYDAQPVCCNECGPRVYILGGDERDGDAIKKARHVIAGGGIAAIKGVGGFHLACDATNEQAVTRLRERKRRPAKPFALMARDIAVAEREAVVPPAAREILLGHQRPIMLLAKRDGGQIAGGVAPGNGKIGVMLPYAPIHYLLFDYPPDDDITMPDVLVMTSGNPSGAPICREDDDARETLSGIADVILSHDRRIRMRADDTVMDFYDDGPCMIRRSRGYAPLPLMIGWEGKSSRSVLAIGGELKNTFCLAKNGLYYPSPYIGDMSDMRTEDALRETVERMMTLLEMRPDAVACDMHPRYRSGAAARDFAERLDAPLIFVQHHYAHVLSCMAENNAVGDEVIGIALDGAGYGIDGTIWGGEIIRANARGFTRLFSIDSFQWAGGDAAAREGWRIAVNMIYDILHDSDEAKKMCMRLNLASEKQIAAQIFMQDNNVNSVTSTSAGRLFDAVSAALGIRRESSFEGEAAMRLQYEAERSNHKDDGYGYAPAAGGESFCLPTRELFRDIVGRYIDGEGIGALAYSFHDGMASILVRGAILSRERTGIGTVALSGGVFQNTLLLRMVESRLKEQNFNVLRHHLLPTGDGGICVGQALAAMMK